MSLAFTETTLVKEIVNQQPKTSDVFKKHRIDFCCGGNTPLITAATEKFVNIEVLMAELTEVYEREENHKDHMEVWTDSSSEDIITHIIEHYHRPLLEELTQLSPYVTKVAKVHGDLHPELIKVYELFREFKQEMIEHSAKEEEIVFPMLKALENHEVENAEEKINYIKELEKEHDHVGEILQALRLITSDYELPYGACGTYTLVYKRLEMLEEQTFMHVHLENNILFPRFL